MSERTVRYTKGEIGKVRIVEIYGDHYANVEPVSGGLPQVGDMVELTGRQP